MNFSTDAQSKEKSWNNILLGCFVLLKLAMQYFMFADGFELHRDEYLHLDQAHHLAWGYLSVPPVTSWLSYLIYLLGNNIFWVKFFPAIFGVLTVILVWKITETLCGALFSRILAAVAVILSSYLRINTLYQPNSLDILCWTFLLFCLIRFISSQKIKWLYWMAIGFAIGFLNKYNICFLVLGLLPVLLITRQRSIFANKHFYLAVLLSVLLISPNLIWQYQNDFPIMVHMSELSSTQLVNGSRISFLIEQVTFFIPFFFVLVFAFIGLGFYKPFKEYRFLGWMYLFVILLYLFFQGKAYYVLGVYPVFFAFGAVFLEHLTQRYRKISYYLVCILFIINLMYIPIICPVFSPERIIKDERIRNLYKKTGQLQWEDGKEHSIPQDYADMVGWSELSGIVESACNQLTDEERKQLIILCDNYGQAGAINYYLNPASRAISYSADYRNWFPEDDYIIKSLILVKQKNSDWESSLSHIPEHEQLFAKVRLIGTVENPMAREEGTMIYLLHDAREGFTVGELKSFR